MSIGDVPNAGMVGDCRRLVVSLRECSGLVAFAGEVISGSKGQLEM